MKTTTTQRAQAASNGRLAQGMNWLERKTGLGFDLDGDDDVGVINDHHNTAAASSSSVNSR